MTRRKVRRWRRETDKRLNFSIVIDCLVPITSRGRGEAGVIENGLWWKLENIRLYPARYIRYIIISCRRSRKAAAARAGAHLEPTLAKLHKRETGEYKWQSSERQISNDSRIYSTGDPRSKRQKLKGYSLFPAILYTPNISGDDVYIYSAHPIVPPLYFSPFYLFDFIFAYILPSRKSCQQKNIHFSFFCLVFILLLLGALLVHIHFWHRRKNKVASTSFELCGARCVNAEVDGIRRNIFFLLLLSSRIVYKPVTTQRARRHCYLIRSHFSFRLL